ncbi:porin family protein [Carboxylicivirga marina]|uniref:PorT family protein n=1 Tax=Carboxylicivirga marina TaxID=2800988 RepID=A0ABS1HHZ7_9BACT|nr:porin family protein [Carboxylicivirga marina]MBK3517296.1 PorT family protein [Carboxylicivirga marina]
MKKTILFLIGSLISLFAFSQESKIAIGLQMANSITSLRGNPMIDDFDSRFVISPGITFDYVLSENLSLNSGLAFERKGAKTDVEYTDKSGSILLNSEVESNFDYLTLPLMLSYHTNSKLKFYFGGGTFLSFLLSQKTIFEGSSIMPEQVEDNTENMKRIDVGLALKAGINLPMNDRFILDLGLRNYLGLLNTSKLDVIDDGSIKTNAFSAVIGVKYKI